MWAPAAASGSTVLVAVVEELDRRRPGTASSSWRASIRNGRVPRATRLMPAVGHPLEHLGDLARAADRAQPVVGEPDDPELRLLLEAARDHRLVALLEDVQRDQLARQRDEARAGTAGSPGPAATEIQSTARRRSPTTMASHRSRLVPARPARPRSPAAARGAGRPRARGAGVRARRPAARRPPRVRQPHAFLLDCLQRPARVAPAARREPRRRRAASPSASCRSWPASTARPRSTSPPTSSPFAMRPRPARRGGAQGGRRRAAPHARQLRRRHRQAQAVRGLHAVLARVEASSRGARSTARRARSPSRAT